MFDQLIYDWNDPNVPISFISQPNLYLLFWLNYFQLFLFQFLGIWYLKIYSFHKNIQFWPSTSDYKSKVICKHQNTIRWIQLIWKIKGGKPNFVNRMFLITLVISSTAPSHSRECQGRELVSIWGWYIR